MEFEALSHVFLGNSLQSWLACALVGVVVYLVLGGTRRILISRLERVAEHSEFPWRQALGVLLVQTRRVFILAVAVAVGAMGLAIPAVAERFGHRVFVFVAIVQVGILGWQFIHFVAMNAIRNLGAENGARVTTIRAVEFIAKAAFFSLLVLWTLDSLGINVTTLVAGLGVGGVAVALAVKGILSDLFASFTIVMDRPFVIGDSISVGDLTGTVERIGLRTTRVRALSGEELVFPNEDLLQSRVRNFKRMHERRVVHRLGVRYDTSIDNLGRVPGWLRECVEQPGVRFDRAHFCSFGDSALIFELVFWIDLPDYVVFMDLQQRILLAIARRLGDEGVGFAFPSKSIYVESLPAGIKT